MTNVWAPAALLLLAIPLTAGATVTWRCPQPNGDVTYSMKECKGGTALDPDRDAAREDQGVRVRKKDESLASLWAMVDRMALAVQMQAARSSRKAIPCANIVEHMRLQKPLVDQPDKAQRDAAFASLETDVYKWTALGCELP